MHYQSVRATQTDFPILTCAAARTADGAYRFAIGARPMKAMLVCPTAAPDELPAAVQAAVPTGSNLRGSAAYRTHLVGCLSSVPYRHWGTWRCSDANSFYVEP